MKYLKIVLPIVLFLVKTNQKLLLPLPQHQPPQPTLQLPLLLMQKIIYPSPKKQQRP